MCAQLPAIIQQDGARLTYTLDPMGNRTAEKITDAAGTVYYTHRRSFDALGRLWQDIGALNQTLTYGYDARGNLKTIDGARTDVADTTTHSYDALDRLTQTLNALDHSELGTDHSELGTDHVFSIKFGSVSLLRATPCRAARRPALPNMPPE